MSEPVDREQILELVKRYMDERAATKKPFVPGETPIPYSGAVADGDEFRAMTDVLLTGWFGLGRKAEEFQREVATLFGRRKGLFVNSGSSANLVAVSTMTSQRVPERVQKGDEVVTCVAGFPTTLNPLIQTGLKVKLVDTSLPTYNANGEQLQEAVTSSTKAIVLAHTLGNPHEMDVVNDLVKDHDLWLIEDCCDALGSSYAGKPAGSFGDLATCSFYPAHHMTTGEGGMVCGDSPYLMKVAESVRDWGRDCWCAPGEDATCGKRFGWKFEHLPEGYDHKYVYSDVGYNLKPLEMQAALGLVQLKKLDSFHDARRRNFRILTRELQGLDDLLILPQATRNSDPSWFAYPMTLGEAVPRREVIAFLEGRKIATRMLFGANLIRHPAYSNLGLGDPNGFPNADIVMDRTFFVGTSPVVSEEMAHYVGKSIREAVLQFAKR